MSFCKYCGAEISEGTAACPSCGKKLVKKDANEKNRTPESILTKTNSLSGTSAKSRVIYIGAAIAAVMILVMIIVMGGRCRASGCSNRKATGTDYCYYHKCDVNGCRKERLSYSNYCYEHRSLYEDTDSEDTGDYGAYSWELKISDVLVYSEYSFTYAEGSLTNNSDSTVKFVKVKGAFKDRSGRVIDTDWTYAVGGEGLSPGESCKWKMSVEKDINIKDCDVSIMGYD